jgi:hypothetical protein
VRACIEAVTELSRHRNVPFSPMLADCVEHTSCQHIQRFVGITASWRSRVFLVGAQYQKLFSSWRVSQRVEFCLPWIRHGDVHTQLAIALPPAKNAFV